MTLDVSAFHPVNVADTCAVWNLMASERLVRIAEAATCAFGLTNYVLYECLDKPRKKEVPEDRELQRRLREARARGSFLSHALSVADLQDMARLEARKRLGKGELSCIAFARRTGLAFLTDDVSAQKLGARELDQKRVQTTPHLFGWLVFVGRIGDSEVDGLVGEHAAMKRHRGNDYRASYHEALRVRLMIRGAGSPPGGHG